MILGGFSKEIDHSDLKDKIAKTFETDLRKAFKEIDKKKRSTAISEIDAKCKKMFEEDVSEKMAPYVSLYRDFITSVIVRRHTPGASEQVVWEFDNGYGASLSNLGTHIELAVVRVDDRGRWKLCYTTPITNDVMRVDSREMLATLLTKILALESVKWDFENER